MSKEEKKKVDLPKIVLYCHLFQDISKGIIQTVKIKVRSETKTIVEFKKDLDALLDIVAKQTNIKFKIKEVKKTLLSPDFSDELPIRNYFDDKDDIYIKVGTEAVPVQVENTEKSKDVVLNYKSITTYSFYVSSETIVRVLVPIPGIEKVKKEDIIATFTDDSLEVKVNNALNGNNYRFAVPKLDAKIIPEKCEAFAKGKDLIIRLRKFKNDDHWSYLFKQKYAGE